MQTFPAYAGTMLLTYDFEEAEVRVTPILGWTHVQGNQAYPILAVRNGGSTFGNAYQFAEDSVYDPIFERHFDDALEWEAFIAEATPPKGKIAKPEVKAKDLDPETLAEAAENLPEETEVEDESDDDPLAHARDREVNPAYLDVDFSDKSYKNNSFWHLEDECVFTVPGGEPYPSEGAEKVKRTEYMALKKDVPEVDYWEVRTDVDAVEREDEDEVEIDLDDVL